MKKFINDIEHRVKKIKKKMLNIAKMNEEEV